ncbi:unnamed protein product [Dibothriocephalus latus]|uniref:Mitochondrial carrier protein n=1 Tax=Dibothriocephalus latus TaxID=60516 RepID=A0A3P7LD83_DIBLA|nr:unnamed protein product [Dibothriocephalus latus]
MERTRTSSAVSSGIPPAASVATDATHFANKPRTLTTVLAGGTAGLCVDLAVYPLDTIKTRLQNFSHSIRHSGQLRLFAGLPVVLCGSAPSAALFFYTYETVKAKSKEHGHPVWLTLGLCAGISEMVACIIRVPYETIKQRAQSQPHVGVRTVLSETIRVDGWAVLYRGYLSTILRGLPFSLIQYPVWEMLKRSLREYNCRVSPSSESSGELSKKQFALCGALAGATAGACTTPFDVAKTRIMLAQVCLCL